MATKVRDLNTNKLFKIAKLNLRGQAKPRNGLGNYNQHHLTGMNCGL
jgi:hypothetical protein